MDVNPIVAISGVIVTAISTLLVTRFNNKKDMALSDRQQISQEQKEIRDDLRGEIKEIRDEMKIWRDRSLHLEDELRNWKEKYTTLELDYLRATARIEELEKRLNQRDEGGE